MIENSWSDGNSFCFNAAVSLFLFELLEKLSACCVLQGGWLPVSSQGGWLPVSSQGGWLPVSSQGGWLPVSSLTEMWAPPLSPYWQLAHARQQGAKQYNANNDVQKFPHYTLHFVLHFAVSLNTSNSLKPVVRLFVSPSVRPAKSPLGPKGPSDAARSCSWISSYI